MASEEEFKLQQNVERLISNVDKNHLRRIRKESFLCGAKCCDDSADHEQLNGCVNACQQNIQTAEEAISQELNNFQNRLQRCAMNCRDSVQDQITGNMDDATARRLQQAVNECAMKCISDNTSSLGAMEKRLDNVLAKLR